MLIEISMTNLTMPSIITVFRNKLSIDPLIYIVVTKECFVFTVSQNMYARNLKYSGKTDR
jgi:hypothetical protein